MNELSLEWFVGERTKSILKQIENKRNCNICSNRTIGTVALFQSIQLFIAYAVLITNMVVLLSKSLFFVSERIKVDYAFNKIGERNASLNYIWSKS